MADSEILAFAGTDTTTNLLTQAEYLADPQREIGNQPGIARGKLVNKVLRQTSLVAAAVALYAAGKQSLNVTDDLTPTELAAILEASLNADFATMVGVQQEKYSVAVATGTANALVGEYLPDITSLTNGMSLFLRPSAANTSTTPTFTPNTGTIAAKPIIKGNNLPLLAKDIAGAGHWLELQYDSVLDKWVLLNPAKGINPAAGATGGNDDKIFWENGQTVTTDYTITTGQNAMTAGPITINNNITVTVPNGSTWSIV